MSPPELIDGRPVREKFRSERVSRLSESGEKLTVGGKSLLTFHPNTRREGRGRRENFRIIAIRNDLFFDRLGGHLTGNSTGGGCLASSLVLCPFGPRLQGRVVIVDPFQLRLTRC